MPHSLLQVDDLAIRLIDTKGIDRTAARADLESLLDNQHTLAVLCSGFNNAPAAEARLLLERAREAGASLAEVSGDDARSIRDLAIRVMLKLREVDLSGELLIQARALDGESLDLDFLQASLHGLQAEFTLARQLLERINRATPSKPQVLIKLIQVCEQMRDYPAAAGYLKHALRIVRDAADLEVKRQRYQALGIW